MMNTKRHHGKRPAALAAGAVLTFAASCFPAGPSGTGPDWSALFARNRVTIAVTDSGLGGLAIMAEAAERLKSAHSFRSVDLVFWNALFSNDSGYNSLPTREDKVRILDSSLRSLAARIKPDLILVGCNTLSVLLDDVPFLKETDIPIAGIVEAGVAGLTEALQNDPRATGLLLGTKTTIAEGAHLRRLVAAGIPESRLVSQPCANLVGLIEEDWRGKKAEELITAYVGEAAGRMPNRGAPVYAALFCTHFGYSEELWKRAFAAHGLTLAGLVNPNSRWIEPLDPPERKNRFARTVVRTRVVSMVEISVGVRESLGEWLGRISPETAASLKSYELVPDLFEWRTPRK